MKPIELTGRQLGKLILLHPNNWVSVNENAGGFTTVYCVDNHEIQVRETPKQIADLIKKNQELNNEQISKINQGRDDRCVRRVTGF